MPFAGRGLDGPLSIIDFIFSFSSNYLNSSSVYFGKYLNFLYYSLRRVIFSFGYSSYSIASPAT